MRIWLGVVFTMILVSFVVGMAARLQREISIQNAQRPGGFTDVRSQWPKYLLETLSPLERDGVIVGQIEGFRPRAWSDDSFALRFHLEPEQTIDLVAAMLLSPVPADHVSVRSFSSSIPTEWRITIDDPLALYYASPAWLNGDEGDMYVLRVDTSINVANIFYYYNF